MTTAPLTNGRLLVLGVAVVAFAGAAFWWLQREPAVPSEPAGAPTVAPPADATPAQGSLAPSPPPPSPPAANPKGRILYPDGSEAPALNGVTETVKLEWNDRPYSKIVRMEVQNGCEWYIHEDGTHSTVVMAPWNGVPAPFGLVAAPSQPLPTLEELQRQAQAGQKPGGR